jgi:hypothetical protein
MTCDLPRIVVPLSGTQKDGDEVDLGTDPDSVRLQWASASEEREAFIGQNILSYSFLPRM